MNAFHVLGIRELGSTVCRGEVTGKSAVPGISVSESRVGARGTTVANTPVVRVRIGEVEIVSRG